MGDSVLKRSLALREILEDLFPNVALSRAGVALLAAEIDSLDHGRMHLASTVNLGNKGHKPRIQLKGLSTS